MSKRKGGQAYILRLNQELRSLRREPLPNIWVSPVGDDLTHLRALVIGPSETPYQHGMFLFDMRFSKTYPHEPPHVQLLTTDDRRVRFNPNLYACGKVCLSILGTWTGPKWTSAESVSTVLLSIQSLMNAKPYHNEPGYEEERDPNAVQNYNDRIQHETLRVAVCGVVEESLNPNKQIAYGFRQVIQAQFMLWYEQLVDRTQGLVHMDGKPFKDPFGGSEATGTFEYTKTLKRLQALKDTIEKSYPNHAPRPFHSQPTTNHEVVSLMASQGFRAPSQRLLKEAEAVETAQLQGISAAPRQDNCYIWDVTVLGSEGTMWENGIFSAELEFHELYPLHPPVLHFTSEMFHPNVTPSGLVCLDCLACDWSPDVSVVAILVSLQLLLECPNTSAATNLGALDMYCNDNAAFRKKARRLAAG